MSSMNGSFRRPCALLAAAIAASAGCGSDGTAPAPEVARTVVTAGAGQVLLPGALLLDAIRVVGHDADGNVVAREGLPVTWVVTAGGGEVESAAVSTSSSGTAIGRWTLGPGLGEQRLEVRIGGSEPATVRAEAVEPGPLGFVSSRFGSRWDAADVFVMNADGAAPVRLTANSTPTGPVRWSPDGRALLYDRDAGDGTTQLYLLELDGLVERRLTSLSTDDPRGLFVGSGDWSPDGSRIVFSIKQGAEGCTFAETNIWIMNREGNGLERVTEGCGWGRMNPDWSPDGRQIAFQQNVEAGGGTGGGDRRVMIMDADGGNLRTLVSPGHSPRWSPDGLRLLYVSGDSVRSVEPDGTGSELVWIPPGVATGTGSWSADGTALVVTTYQDGGGEVADIYRYDLLDGAARNLTATPARDVGVDWREDP